MKIKAWRETPEVYPLHRVRIIDGDTLEADIRLAFDTTINRRIRLKGWWADETEGPFRSSGMQATFLLECFCADKALWLHAPSCRLDKYGRVVGHLMHGGRIVDPRDVLGKLQLTEAEHKRRRDAQAAARKQAKAWPDDKGSTNTAEPESKRPINDPTAIYRPKPGGSPEPGADWP